MISAVHSTWIFIQKQRNMPRWEFLLLIKLAIELEKYKYSEIIKDCEGSVSFGSRGMRKEGQYRNKSRPYAWGLNAKRCAKSLHFCLLFFTGFWSLMAPAGNIYNLCSTSWLKSWEDHHYWLKPTIDAPQCHIYNIVRSWLKIMHTDKNRNHHHFYYWHILHMIRIDRPVLLVMFHITTVLAN